MRVNLPKKTAIVCFAAMVCWAATVVADEAVKDKMGALREKLGDPKKDEVLALDRSERERYRQALDEIERLLADNNLVEARQRAQNALQMASSSDGRKFWTDIFNDLDRKYSTLRDNYPETVRLAILASGEAANTAKKPSELDKPLAELRTLQNQGAKLGTMNYREESWARLNAAVERVRSWQAVLDAEQSGDKAGALSAVNDLLTQAARGSSVSVTSSSGMSVSYSAPAIPSRDVMIAKQKELYQSVEALETEFLTQLAPKLAAAATPDAVQRVSDEYEAGVKRFAARSGSGGGTFERARVTLTGWQKLVNAQSMGRYRDAVTSLDQLVQGNPDFRLISSRQFAAKREELAKQSSAQSDRIDEPGLSQVVELLDKTSGADALADASGNLTKLLGQWQQGYVGDRMSSLLGNEVQSAVLDARSLAMLKQYTEARQFSRVWMLGASDAATGVPHRWRKKMLAARTELFTRAILAAFPIPKIEVKGPDESPDRMLIRVAEESLAKGDYKATLLSLDAYRVVFYPTGARPSWLDSGINGCSLLAAGDNFADAGQHVDAARAYRTILMLTGPFVPAKDAGVRLSKLGEKQAAAVASAATQPAMTLPSPPPTPVPMHNSTGMMPPPGYDAGRGINAPALVRPSE